MYTLNKSGLILQIVVHLALFASKFAECKRMSFKDSLTAYAENKTPSKIGLGFQTESEKQWENQSLSAKLRMLSSPTLHVEQEEATRDTGSSADNKRHVLEPVTAAPLPVNERDSKGANQFSLWHLTKYLPFSIGQNIPTAATSVLGDRNHFASGSNAPRQNTSPFLTPEKPAQSLNTIYHEMTSADNGRDTPKTNVFNKNYTNVQNTNAQTLKADEIPEEQRRDKKDANRNPGLRQVLWNTANQLWSVNKEHFLPTFLHTKTGGKLSLVRESIFKPVTILSQFKSGVQEINNEKVRNLARLSTGGGYGWHRPSTVLLKVQPENSYFMTLAKYALRLTKHTAITKYKLKRALLDLQFRAFLKLINILKSKTVAQKIATLRILTGAAWKGKTAILRTLLSEFGRPKPKAPYSGVDNSVNVDITYSGYNKNTGDQKWKDYVPTPPPSYSPPDSYSPPQSYSSPNSYSPPQSYSPPDSYSPPQTYSPPESYSPPPKYAPPEGYSPPPKYSLPESYSTPPSYSPPPTYSAPAGYSPPASYSAPTGYSPPAADYSPPQSYSPPQPGSSAVASSNQYRTLFNPVETPPGPPSTDIAPSSSKQSISSSFDPLLTSVFTRSTYADSPPAPTPKKPLIEQPSYASLLKAIGIKTTNDADFSSSSRTTTESSLEIPAPKPTVVYYSSQPTENLYQSPIDTQTVHKSPTPVISHYPRTSSEAPPSSWHAKLPILSNDYNNVRTFSNDVNTRSNTPTSFRLKLLESMNL